MNTEEIKKAVAAYRNGETQASERVYEALRYYCVKLVRGKYADYAVKYYEDLMSCCFLGIAEGMKEYDPEKSSLTTWFTPFMVHEIEEFLSVQVNHMSMHYFVSNRKIMKSGYDEEEDEEIIAGKSSLAVKTVREVKRIKSMKISSISGEEKAFEIPSEYGNPEAEFLRMEKKDAIAEILDVLNEREKFIVVLKYGLFGQERKTNIELGKSLGITANRVSQINRDALRKIRTRTPKKIDVKSALL